MNETYDVNLVADYVCRKALLADTSISVLKLQKLLYYIQAWHLAFYRRPLLNTDFRAWVHGPVSKAVYRRYKNVKSMYSDISFSDLTAKDADFRTLSRHAIAHITSVLDTYMKYTGSQLEVLTHKEAPWIEARKGFAPFDPCDVVIDETLMAKFYSQQAAS